MAEESGEKTWKLEYIPTNFMEKWVAEELEMIGEFEEKAVAEVMKWLEEEISKPSSKPSPTPIAEDFSSRNEGEEKKFHYYQTPMAVTINGNEETCGPSFSDATSTVMASFDTRTITGSGLSYFIGAPSSGPWYGGNIVDKSSPSVAHSNESFASMDDGDCDDDEWLARVLSAPVFEIDEVEVVP